MEPSDASGSTSPRPFPASAGIPGLAVASLVLGILALVSSVIVVGALLALPGLVLGALHLKRRRDARVMGWSGVWLSILALVASGGFLALYVAGIRHMSESQMGGGTTDYAQWHGKPAPDLELTTLDGSPLRLSDLQGRRVILDFWATWCGPCVKEIPHFIQLQQEHSTNELVIVGVSSEDRAVLKPFANARSMNYPVASSLGQELPPPFDRIRAIPTTFFLSREGIIEEVVVGYLDYEALKEKAIRGGAPGQAGGAGGGE